MRPSDLIVPTPWLPAPPPPKESGVVGALVKGLIGVGAGALFWYWQWRTLAVVVWSIAGLVTLASVASPSIRDGINRGFALLGKGMGTLVSWIFLVPLFFIGFSAVHLMHKLSGRDPLRLKVDDRPSYWIASDSEARSAKQVRSLFAAERPAEAGGRRWPAMILGLAMLLIVAEVGLRLFGYGDPILYVNDPVVGYYPQAIQDVTRQGKRIAINAQSMRSIPISPEKPPGAFRILMLGDSTLYGGAYVDQADIYASRVDALLEKDAGPVEILNMGVNGWGAFHQIAWVEQFGHYNADLAIITLPYADLFRPLTSLASKPYLTSKPMFALQEVAHHLMWRTRNTAIGKPDPKLREAQGKRGVVAYSKLANLLRLKGVEVIIEVLPSRTAGTTGAAKKTEKDWVSMLMYQLGAYRLGYPEGLFKAEGAAAYHDFVHLSATGHARYAAYLNTQIRTNSEAFQRFARSSPEGEQ
ncbi:MAG: hypothetical protein ACI9U2_003341 [Bradymonadia bacterium]|jgi:hypothetical protein